MSMSDVKILKLDTNEDIVCKLTESEQANMVVCHKPLLMRTVPQITRVGITEQMTLMRWIPFSRDNSTTVPRDKIVAISNADDVLKEKYHKIAVNYEILDKEADNIAKDIEKDPRESSISTSDKIQKKIRDYTDFYTKNKTIH